MELSHLDKEGTTNYLHELYSYACSKKSFDLSVFRIESLPVNERSKTENMLLIQLVSDRYLDEVSVRNLNQIN